MREPSVVFASSDAIGKFLIVELPDRSDAQVVRLDEERGYPSFKGIIGFDTFRTKKEAISYLRTLAPSISMHEHYMVAGIFPIGSATIIVFITSVKQCGTFLQSHKVYDVRGLKFELANKCVLQPNEIKAFSQISSFKVFPGHFICHTYDMSMPMNTIASQDCVWNKSISRPFDFFELGKLCPKIIEGTFRLYEFGGFVLYNVTRIVCESCGPVTKLRGTTGSGGLGNMALTEIVLSHLVGDSIEIRSALIFRGTTPIAFRQGMLAPEQVPFSSIPVWIHKTCETYNLESLAIYDFGHSICSKNMDISAALNETISFVRDNFSVSLQQFDWECLNKQMSPEKALSTLTDLIDQYTGRVPSNHGFLDKNKFSWDSKQKSAIVVTSLNGLDRSSVGSFIIISRIISRFIQGVQCNLTFKANIISFVADATMISSDVIAKLSVGTESISHNEISRLVHSPQSFKIKMQREAVIQIDRQKKSFEEARLLSLSLFSGKQMKPFIPSYFPSVSSNIRCVSEPPSACVLSPQCGTQILMKKRTTYRLSDGPLIIFLSEPCCINEIIIEIPSSLEKLSTPSSFSAFGGSYYNRLFPIFEDQAIPINEISTGLSYKFTTPKHYSHECIASSLTLIRFIVFHFESPIDLFVLDGIRIYGSPVLPLQPQKCQIALSPLISKPEFWEDLSHENSIQWEERRLCALMPIQDYLFSISKKDINPGTVLSDHVFRLMHSLIDENQPNTCSICGNPAHFKCGLCRKIYCHSCTKENDSHDQMSDPQNICKLCTACSDRRYKMCAAVTRLIALNTRMAKELYPFINQEEGNYYLKSPILVNQASFGDNNVTVEKMMSNDNTDYWEPKVNISRLDFLFKQNSKIKSFSFTCRTKFTIQIDSTFYTCEPPGTSFPINLTGKRITLIVIGDNVSISHLSFETEPEKEMFSFIERPLPSLDFQVIRSKTTTNVGSRRQNLFPLFESTILNVSGIEFNEINAVKSFICIINADKDQKFLRFCVPKLKGTHRVLFPTQVECSIITIWYTEIYEAFSMPQVKLLSII